MILFYLDEISAHPVRTDLTQQLLMETNFHPDRVGQVSTRYLFTRRHRFPLIKKCSQNDEILIKYLFTFFSQIDIIYALKIQ